MITKRNGPIPRINAGLCVLWRSSLHQISTPQDQNHPFVEQIFALIPSQQLKESWQYSGWDVLTWFPSRANKHPWVEKAMFLGSIVSSCKEKGTVTSKSLLPWAETYLPVTTWCVFSAVLCDGRFGPPTFTGQKLMWMLQKFAEEMKAQDVSEIWETISVIYILGITRSLKYLVFPWNVIGEVGLGKVILAEIHQSGCLWIT